MEELLKKHTLKENVNRLGIGEVLLIKNKS